MKRRNQRRRGLMESRTRLAVTPMCDECGPSGLGYWAICWERDDGSSNNAVCARCYRQAMGRAPNAQRQS